MELTEGTPLLGWTTNLAPNIRLTNTLAYHYTESITAVKSFIIQQTFAIIILRVTQEQKIDKNDFI
jgi:hypothetical protein